MRTRDDEEARRQWLGNAGRTDTDATLRADMLALLKRVEWEGYDEYSGEECPTCHALAPHGDPTRGHAPTCDLAAMIRRLEGA